MTKGLRRNDAAHGWEAGIALFMIIKMIFMFFKKKKLITPAWWMAVDRKQKVYMRRLAVYLERKASTIPVERVRHYMILGLVTLGTLDILMIVAFPGKLGGAYIPTSFGHARQMILPASPKPAPATDFQSFLDSLKRIPANHRVLDSLLQARPGMADTLRRLEEMLKNSQ